MTTDHELRYAAFDDVPRLAALMGSAFMRDPVSRWLFPDETDRAVRHPAFFQVLLDQAVTRGTVHRTADYTAVALWLMVGPGGPFATTRSAEAALMEACGPNYDRFRDLDYLMQLHHPASGRHAYLPFIAVAPERWGQGIGTVLLRHRLSQLDLAGLPAYLEASSNRSRALYQRLGFQPTTDTLNLPGGPSLFPMWRTAPAQAAARWPTNATAHWTNRESRPRS
jgi:ribosomal protein S18 acetylase RimI-like enzyme